MVNGFKRIFLISLFLISSLIAQNWQVEDVGVFEVLHLGTAGDRAYALPSGQEVGLAIIDFINDDPSLLIDREGLEFIEMAPDSAIYLYNPVAMHVNEVGEVLVALNHGPRSKIFHRNRLGEWDKVFDEEIYISKMLGLNNFVLIEFYDDFGLRRKITEDFGGNWIDVEWPDVWGLTENISWQPDNESTLYVANYSGLFKSVDRGMTISETLLDNQIQDVLFVTGERGEHKLVASVGWFVFTDSLLLSYDYGNSWNKIEGHPGFIKMDTTPEPNEIIGITSDSFGISKDGGLNWEFYSVEHPTLDDPEILLNIKSSKNYPKRFFIGSWIGGFYYSNDEGVSWNNVTIPRGYVADVASINTDHMYLASGISGGLHKKIGKEWETIYFSYEVQPTLIRINPDDPDIVYCAFYDQLGGLIPFLNLKKSTDSGETWKEIFLQETIQGAADLKFDPKNSDILYLATGLPAVTGDVTLWKSTDAGTTWDSLYAEENFTAKSILIDPNNSDHIIVAGDPTVIPENGQKRLIRSIDGGETWQVVWETEDINHVYNLLYAETDQEGVLFLTSDKGLLKSTDFGDTWEVSLSDSLREITQDPVTGNLLAFSLKKHQLYISGNLGETWIEENSFTEQTGVNYVTKLHATTDARGQSKLFAGTFGAGLFSSPSILVSVEDEFNEDIPNNFHLAQNYPNPFNPSTTIEFSIPQSGLYEIAVYNILGQKVKTLLRDELQPGYHKIEFNAAELASGIYLYKLTGNNITLTKKMILIK